MLLTRIAKNSTESISVALFDASGDPLTSETVTLDLYRADGTQLLDGEATTEASGVYSKALSVTETGQIDRLRAVWSYSSSRSVTTYHDVVGCHYFPTSELRDLEPLSDTGKYDQDKLVEVRDLATYALEEACNASFCERHAAYSFDGDGSREVVIQDPHIVELVAASVDGTALTLSTIDLRRGGRVRLPAGSVWTWHADCEIHYSRALMKAPEPRVAHAVKLIAREVAFSDLDSAIPERATSLNTEAGSFALVTAGVAGQAFDLPEVNAVVSEYRAQGMPFYV